MPDILRTCALLGAVGTFAIAPAQFSMAQGVGDEEGGLTLNFTLSQTIEASDNVDLEDPPNGAVLGITRLSGTLESATRSRVLSLGFNTGLEIGDGETVLDDSGVDLSYTMFSASSELEVFGSYDRSDITTETELDPDDDGDIDLTVTSGRRDIYTYGARLLTGRDGPLTFRLRGSQRETTFDSADPDAVDSSRLLVTSSLEAALDPATTGRITARYTDTEDDDVANSTETDYTIGVGVTRQLASASSVSLDIDYQNITTTGGTTTEFSGIGGRLAFNRELPSGRFGASLERDITVDGTIDTLRLSRGFEFPASSLTVDVGAVLTDGSTVTPIAGINYERLAPDSSFNVSLSQEAGISDEQTVINTIGSVGYSRTVNAVSSIRADVSLTNQAVVGVDDTTRRINGTLSYNRQLTEDIDLRLGYEHRRLFETGTDERTANTVFVTLSRTFSARP